MAKIVPNPPLDPEKAAAIAAFGAQAEHPPEVTAPAVAAAAAAAVKPATGSIDRPKGPKNTLLRWDGNEELRDNVIEFATNERYSTHAVLIKAIEIGLVELKRQAGTGLPLSPNIM